MLVRVAEIFKAVRMLQTNTFAFGKFTDMFEKKQAKKNEEQFKKEMEYLANKPQFTLMDFKTRVEDEMQKLNSQIKAKFSTQTQQREKELQIQKKVLCALFEEQLLLQKKIKGFDKKQVSLVAQVDQKQVNQTIMKFEQYKNMHQILRQMKVNHEPLPETMEELQYVYARSGLGHSQAGGKYRQYKKYSRRERMRQVKFGVID